MLQRQRLEQDSIIEEVDDEGSPQNWMQFAFGDLEVAFIFIELKSLCTYHDDFRFSIICSSINKDKKTYFYIHHRDTLSAYSRLENHQRICIPQRINTNFMMVEFRWWIMLIELWYYLICLMNLLHMIVYNLYYQRNEH